MIECAVCFLSDRDLPAHTDAWDYFRHDGDAVTCLYHYRLREDFGA